MNKPTTTSSLEALRCIEMETRDGGQWNAAEINEVARAALSQSSSFVDAETLIRDLLWNEHPECCGQPADGCDRGDLVCCGMFEPAMLNDKQIVATLRARFPDGEATPCKTVPVEEYRRVVGRCIDLAEKLVGPLSDPDGHERAKFEAWYLRDHFDATTSAASLAWSAWQAATKRANALHTLGAAGPLGDPDVLASPKSA